MLTAGGAVIAETGEADAGLDRDDSIVVTDLSSGRYAIKATISASHARACRQPGRSARIGDHRQRTSRDRHPRAFGPAAAARARQSDRRDRAGAQGRRVRAVLPADRRHPLGPVARRGGADPLAQAGRHHRAAGVVHTAGRIERPHHRTDARADAARLPGGRRRARRAAASQDRLQPDGPSFRQRGDRRRRPQDFQANRRCGCRRSCSR